MPDIKIANKSKTVRIAVITLIASVMVIALSALGIWQIERLNWKHDLTQRVERNVYADPIQAPDQLSWEKSDHKALEYRSVTISGHYLNDLETPIAALTEKGSGYWIVTPFMRDTGEITFINRGYVVTTKRDAETRIDGQIEGPTSVTGLLRLTEPKGFFLRQNQPDANIWHSRDTEALAKHLHLNKVTSYFIDANAAQNNKDTPVGGMTVIKFADNHLSYAITWFVLAGMVMLMAFFLIRYEISGKNSKE